MYKLFNENQNKNTLKEEYDKLISSFSSSNKITNEESSLLLYEEFTKDIINYISYNIIKMDELSKNKKNNIDLDSYLKAFIDKLLNILDMNTIINSNAEFYKLIYINISSFLIEEDNDNTLKFIYILFYKIFVSYLKDNKDNYNYYKDKINKLSNLIKQIMQYISDDNDDDELVDNNNEYMILYSKINNSFIKEFLPNFINEYISILLKNENEKDICLFDIINNFLFYYENIIHEISIKYFPSYNALNWRKNYLENLDTCIINTINKNNINNFNEKDIDKINEVLISKNYISINKIFSILFHNNELFNNFFNILMKSIEKYLMNEIVKENDFYNKIEIIYNIEKELLNINNNNFFFIDKKIDVKTIYHKLIFDIFCKDKNNSVNEIMVNAFDSIIRKTDNENELKKKSNILFKYIDIIPNYENFESLYIHSIINRSIEDIII